MPRINIEDSLFKDPRYSELILKMGSRHAALGAFVEACILAQEFFLNEESSRMIPLTEWKRRKAVGFIIDVGLAEIKGENQEYVYVVGSEAQFAWLLQRKEAGAKGGRPKNQKVPDEIKQGDSKADESGRLAEQSGSNPLTLSLTHSLSLTQSKNSNSNNIIHDDVKQNAQIVSTPARKSSPRGCINEFSFDHISVELLKNVTESLQRAWLTAYPNAQWICHEIRKANAWCEANPKKRPKDFGRFMNTWLNNGFEQYRKGIATNKGNFVQRNNDELRRKVEAGEL